VLVFATCCGRARDNEIGLVVTQRGALGGQLDAALACQHHDISVDAGRGWCGRLAAALASLLGNRPAVVVQAWADAHEV